MVGGDQEAIEFLLTQHMIAADDEIGEDREALAFIGSHKNFQDIRIASARQVTVTRDGAGNLQEVRPNDRSRHQINYSTLNQDDELGRWAAVEPFSAAGARAALDAILLPSLWSQRAA
jgi:YD repeat-containing protein